MNFFARAPFRPIYLDMGQVQEFLQKELVYIAGFLVGRMLTRLLVDDTRYATVTSGSNGAVGEMGKTPLPTSTSHNERSGVHRSQPRLVARTRGG
ncbi:MAG: hypothetical protein ABFD51_06360 [Anaerolineaceae bacterium]